MSSGKAWSGGGCGEPSISMASPPWSFCFGFAGWPSTRTCSFSMRSWTRARLMSGMAWARYWSRRRPAASGAAVKVRTPSWGSSSSRSMVGMTGGGGGSAPRVARYSGLTVRRRWPLGSMCLDGMGSGLSRFKYQDKACDEDHGERDPLDGVEQIAEGNRIGVWLAEEGQKELRDA